METVFSYQGHTSFWLMSFNISFFGKLWLPWVYKKEGLKLSYTESDSEVSQDQCCARGNLTYITGIANQGTQDVLGVQFQSAPAKLADGQGRWEHLECPRSTIPAIGGSARQVWLCFRPNRTSVCCPKRGDAFKERTQDPICYLSWSALCTLDTGDKTQEEEVFPQPNTF